MDEFNISEFLEYFLNKILIVICSIIIGVIGSWYYTSKIQVPMYKSETKLVLARSDNNIPTTQTDISLNKSLVATYREIIKSRRILTKVINSLNLNMTEAQLKKKISVTSAADTELILISVKDENSKQAMEIANAIADVFKTEIPTIYNIENISIVDKAIETTEPYNINTVKQYLVGFALGLIIGSAVVTMIFYFDDTVKSQEEIENKIGVSVLASVPKYKSKESKKGSKRG